MGEDPGNHPGEGATGAATRERDHTGASRSANSDPSRRTNPREGTTTGTTQKDATSKDQPGGRLTTEDEAEKPRPEDPNEGFKERQKKMKSEDELVHPCQQRNPTYNYTKCYLILFYRLYSLDQ